MRKHAAIVQPLALAFLLAVGFATAFALLVAWGLLVIDHVIQPRPITRYVVVQAMAHPSFESIPRYQTAIRPWMARRSRSARSNGPSPAPLF